MPDSKAGSIAFLICLMLPIVLILSYANHKGKQAVVQEVRASAIATPSATISQTVAEETGDAEASEEIDAYIRTIFGPDAPVAIAVNRVECNPQNKNYPQCVYHTNYEYSVGIFQINLYNSSHWIHAKKVPGETMDEKVEWLKNPYNNTLIAYKIFTDSGSFAPWSGFTSGRYLNHLGE